MDSENQTHHCGGHVRIRTTHCPLQQLVGDGGGGGGEEKEHREPASLPSPPTQALGLWDGVVDIQGGCLSLS